MSAARFGEVLKQLREKAGLSQKELAERLRTNQANISRWENGQGEPGLSILGLLAAALGVSAESLVLPTEKATGKRLSAAGRLSRSETIATARVVRTTRAGGRQDTHPTSKRPKK